MTHAVKQDRGARRSPRIFLHTLYDALAGASHSGIRAPEHRRSYNPYQRRRHDRADQPALHFERPVAAAEKLHRSEEHTSELQSPCNLVCRLLLEKYNSLDANVADHTMYTRGTSQDNLVILG